MTRTRSPSAWMVPVTTWLAPSAFADRLRRRAGVLASGGVGQHEDPGIRGEVGNHLLGQAARQPVPAAGLGLVLERQHRHRGAGGRRRRGRALRAVAQRPERSRPRSPGLPGRPSPGTAAPPRGARHGFALRRQPIAPAAHGLDSVAGSANRPPDVADALHQAVVGDGDVTPYRIVQFVLRHGLAAPRRQRPQHLGGLDAQLGLGPVRRAHPSCREVDRCIPEGEAFACHSRRPGFGLFRLDFGSAS